MNDHWPCFNLTNFPSLQTGSQLEYQIPDLRNGKFYRNGICLEILRLEFGEKKYFGKPHISLDKNRTFLIFPAGVPWNNPLQDPDGAYVPIWATDLRANPRDWPWRNVLRWWFDRETWRLNYESGPFTAKNVDFPFRNEDFTVKNDDFTKNNEDLTMEKGDLGMQNEDFTMKNEDLI